MTQRAKRHAGIAALLTAQAALAASAPIDAELLEFLGSEDAEESEFLDFLTWRRDDSANKGKAEKAAATKESASKSAPPKEKQK